MHRAAQWCPHPPLHWIVCGGGRHNAAIMDALQASLPGVVPAEHVGWAGDAIEAQAFAVLAARAVRGLPISFPGTTGAPTPLTGGTLHRA